jgi:hypothetical protein
LEYLTFYCSQDSTLMEHLVQIFQQLSTGNVLDKQVLLEWKEKKKFKLVESQEVIQRIKKASQPFFE